MKMKIIEVVALVKLNFTLNFSSIVSGQLTQLSSWRVYFHSVL
uniref:Uncharacterized protein n=1 Tax=Arundo donax TaxID=35708 RepID=A0A0A8YH96_ARUDO